MFHSEDGAAKPASFEIIVCYLLSKFLPRTSIIPMLTREPAKHDFRAGQI